MTMFWPLFTIVTCIKILYIPSYRSTDFEVHRNWLAVTASVNLTSWYTEDTSPWTLDYPPYFAYFEWLLGKVAVYADPAMLEVTNLDHASPATILFQRGSVITTDIVLALGAKQCAQALARKPHQEVVMVVLLLSNMGLFLVDHIHFQYNGLLSGLLLLSISAVAGARWAEAALLFSGLLMMKHIYLYIAPAFIVYMLRSCFQTSAEGATIWTSFSPLRLATLAVCVLTNAALALGPFLLSDNLGNLVTRLFPFRRGLCHAYWAPNLWAVYNVVDKVLARLLGVTAPAGSMTGGLVQDIEHAVLPPISPATTLALTSLLWLPALVKLWSCPNNTLQFIRCLVVCGWTSFLCGWHVHEKAILVVILPLTLLAGVSRTDARQHVLVSTLGHVSLLPLLFTLPELVTKLLLLAVTQLVLATTLVPHAAPLHPLERLYLVAGVPLVLGAELLPLPRLPFLPLLLYSLYTALGILYTYARLYASYLTS